MKRRPFASLVSAVACLGSAFLPWSRSGTLTRSGYSLLASAQRAGIVTHAWARVLAVAAYLLPVLAAGATAAFLVRRFRLVRVLALAAGAVVLLGSSIAWSDVRTGQRFGIGASVGVGTLTVLAAGAGLVQSARAQRRTRRGKAAE